jgi:hypothetical protein
LKAVYHKEGYLSAVKLRTAYRRREKIVLSLIPAVWFVFIFFKNFRLRLKTFEFESRPHA